MGLCDKLFKGRRKAITQECPVDAAINSETQNSSNNTIAQKEIAAKKSISDSLATSKTVEKPPISEKVYRVAGTSYRTDNILKLAEENSDYEKTKKELIEDGLTDTRVWKFEFYPSKVELIPEPDNPQDSNAIKVVVDGEHIGYIKAGSCSHLHKAMKKDGILSISCEISGGPYKYLCEEYDSDKDKDVYTLERGETNLFATLYIREKVGK